MALAVTTIAPTTALTTAARMRDAGLAFPTSDDGDVDRIIASASAAIVNYCGRPFAREDVVEQCPGFGDVHLALTRSPILSVASVTASQSVIEDFSIAHRDQALLFRSVGWGWSVAQYGGLGVGGGHSDAFLFRAGTPLPNQESPNFLVEYIAGYILPSQFISTDEEDLTVSAIDNSLNSSTGAFPSLLLANDVVVTRGFSEPQNNGRFRVTGTPTPFSIEVDATLVTEGGVVPGSPRTIRFDPPAECRPFDDVERACFEAVKSWYSSRGRESALVERQMSSTRVRWSEQDVARSLGLPPSCIGLLASWRRFV